MKPFKRKPPHNSKLIERLIGYDKYKGALIDINNLLADATDIKILDAYSVYEIYKKWGINHGGVLYGFFKKNLAKLAMEFLKYHLIEQGNYNLKVLEDFSHLCSILGISLDQIKPHAPALLKLLVDKIVQDENYSDEEKNILSSLLTTLSFSQEELTRILKKAIETRVHEIIKAGIRDGEWSIEEEERLMNFAKEFNIQLKLDKKTQQIIERMHMVWKINNDLLESIPVDINLRKGETCYYILDAELHTYKKETKYVSQVGPLVTFGITRNLYITGGTKSMRKEEREILKKEDFGKLYITNQRLIFIASRNSLSISYSDILKVDTYSDGFVIYKEKGKPLVFMTRDSEIASLLIHKFMTGAE